MFHETKIIISACFNKLGTTIVSVIILTTSLRQGCIKILGTFIKSVLKRGREYHGCGEENNVEKYQVGRGENFRGRKSRFLKMVGGEEYQVVGNFIHPWFTPCRNQAYKISLYLVRFSFQ